MADNSVIVEFGAKIDELLSGINDAKSAITSFATSAAEAFAAAFSLHEINAFVDRMTEMNVQVERAAAILGISAEQVSQFSIAAQVGGTSLEALSLSMGRLEMNLARADSNAISPAAAAMKGLGLNVKDFLALPMNERVYAIADAFARLTIDSDRAAFAQALLGRGGIALLASLIQGSAAFREYDAIAERAGSKSFPEFTAAAEKLHLQTIEVGKSFDGLGMSILTGLEPPLSGAYKLISDTVEAMNNSIRAGGLFAEMLRVVAIAVGALLTPIVILIQTIKQLYAVLDLAASGLTAFSAGVGAAIEAIASGNVTAAKNALVSIPQSFKDAWDNYTAAIKESNSTAAAELRSIWVRETADHKTQLDQRKAHLDLFNSQAVSAAMAAAQERIKIAKLEYEMTTERIKASFGDFWFTETSKTNALLDAVNQRERVQLAAVQDEINAAGASVAARQKAENEKTTIIAEAARDRQKIVLAEVKAEEDSFKTMGLGLVSAFDTQLRGLLAGTTSFAAAMKATLGNFIIFLIQETEKEAVAWAAHELFKTSVTEAGVAARTTAEATGNAAASAFSVAGAIRSILNSAAQTFAGVFAFLSPTEGPFAAAPAAAASGLVAAAAGSVASVAIGTDYVARTGLAIVHQGEAVVPADVAGGGFTGTGMGGMNVSFNINAVDAHSFSNLVNNNPSIFTDLIRKAIRDQRMPSVSLARNLG